MRLRRAVGAVALTAFLSATGALMADAATVSVVASGDGTNAVSLSGKIEDGDALAFATAMATGSPVGAVVLSSPGGRLGEGARIAEAVKRAGLTVVVPDGVVCASSCFMIFAAGGRKYVGRTARIGVHNASEVGGRVSKDSEAVTLEMAQDAKRLGVPEVIIGKMVVTPPSGIAWLTDEELLLMGAVRTGSSGAVAYAAPKARIAPADGWVPSYADAMGSRRTKAR